MPKGSTREWLRTKTCQIHGYHADDAPESSLSPSTEAAAARIGSAKS